MGRKSVIIRGDGRYEGTSIDRALGKMPEQARRRAVGRSKRANNNRPSERSNAPASVQDLWKGSRDEGSKPNIERVYHA